MDIYQSAVIFVVMTLICAYFIAMAYKNVKFVLKHKYVTSLYFSSFIHSSKRFVTDGINI